MVNSLVSVLMVSILIYLILSYIPFIIIVFIVIQRTPERLSIHLPIHIRTCLSMLNSTFQFVRICHILLTCLLNFLYI